MLSALWIRWLQYAFIAIIVTTVGFSLYQWNASRAAVKLQQSTSVNLSNGLVGYWSFDGDDISGTTAYDRSGSANNGTLTNGPTKTAGRIGQALNFDGSNDYVDLAHPSSLKITTSLSVGAWVYRTGVLDDFSGIISSEKTSFNTGGYILVGTSTNKVRFYIDQNALGTAWAYAETNDTIPLNSWTHLVGLWDGTTVKLYVNGVLQSATGSASTMVYGTFSQNAYIGLYGEPVSAKYFPGKIDDVRIYNRQISATEVLSLYDLGNPDKVNAAQGDTLEQGLVGYWKLDDGGGTSATDSSGNANTGTLTNGPTWGTGRIGSDVVFDGTDDYIAATNINNTTNKMSYSLWVKFNSVVNGRYIISEAKSGAPGGDIWGIDVNTGKFEIFIATGASPTWSPTCIGTTLIVADTWYYVTSVYDGANLSLYVNGIQEKSVAQTGNITATNRPMLIGAESYYTSYFTNANIDEVRVYNRALSDEEVTKLYRETVPDNPDTGLVGYWPMNGKDINGTTAYDRSGKGNTGTLTNGPTRTAGRIGQALNFDGVNDRISTTTDVIGTGATSICTWAYPRSTGGGGFGRIVVSQDGGGTEKTLFLMQSGPRIGLSSNGGGTNLITANTITYNQWIHVCATRDGSGNGLIYVNGILENSGTTGTPSSGGTTVQIGDKSLGGRTFDGLIDDVRIYNRQISAGEIQSLYDLGNPDKVNTPQGDPLEQGLVGYWKLDDASGTSATDSSGNANAGTLTNGPTWGTGRIGGDVVFDGTNDYINLGNSSILNFTNNFSISLWVNINNITQAGYKRFFGGDDINGSTRPVYLEYDYAANQYRAVWQNGGTYGSVAGKTLTAVGWQHFVVTFKDGVAKSYSDGALIGSSSSVVQPPSTAVNSYIGGTSGGGAFPGSIDEVRIYNRALSDEEVTKLYRETVPDNPDTGLVGYWPFNGKDISGTTAYDRSGKGNNGTLTNGPTRTAGRIGQALNFDGTNDYVTVPTSSALNFAYNQDFSVLLWAKVPATQIDTGMVGNIILQKWSNGTGGYPYAIRLFNQTYGTVADRGKVYALRYDGTNAPLVVSGVKINDNTWHHIGYTKSGSTLSLYIDGTSSVVTGTDTTTGTTTNADSLYMGMEVGSLYQLTGSLDEPRIYNRALTAAEVATLYSAGR